jgi:hypothetical protein
MHAVDSVCYMFMHRRDGIGQPLRQPRTWGPNGPSYQKKYPGISATLRYLGEVQVERDAYRFSGSTRRCDWEIEIESIIPEMTTYLLRQRGTQYREGSEM